MLNQYLLKPGSVKLICCEKTCTYLRCSMQGDKFEESDDGLKWKHLVDVYSLICRKRPEWRHPVPNFKSDLCPNLESFSQTFVMNNKTNARIGEVKLFGACLRYFKKGKKGELVYTRTKFSKHVIKKDHLLGNVLSGSPSWDSTGYPFTTKTLNDMYTVKLQQPMVSSQCKKQTAQWYVWDKVRKVWDTNHMFARGHLTPAADYQLVPQKFSTYHYFNSAPQWQMFNQGKWAALEKLIRKVHLDNSKAPPLKVLTGTYGEMKCDAKTILYLKGDSGSGKNKKTIHISIPTIFYKILYHPGLKTGAFIAISNHPTMKIPDIKKNSDYYVCHDICKDLHPNPPPKKPTTVISWLRNDLKFECNDKAIDKTNFLPTGFTYACEVDKKLLKKLQISEKTYTSDLL